VARPTTFRRPEFSDGDPASATRRDGDRPDVPALVAQIKEMANAAPITIRHTMTSQLSECVWVNAKWFEYREQHRQRQVVVVHRAPLPRAPAAVRLRPACFARMSSQCAGMITKKTFARIVPSIAPTR
jgi:hypothetical protein